jgi:hypothetical protein
MDCSDFPQGKNPTTGRRYYRVDYEIKFNLDGRVLTYECIIPRSGVFPDEHSYGPLPFRAEGAMNVGAAFPIGES